MYYVTKFTLSETDFLNMTVRSLYSNGFHSHQIQIAPLGCPGMKDSHQDTFANKSGVTYVKMDQITIITIIITYKIDIFAFNS